MNPETMTRTQARTEYDRISNFRSLSTADMRRMNQCLARIADLDAESPAPKRPIDIAGPAQKMREQLDALRRVN